MQNNWLNTRPIMNIQDTYALRGVCMLMIIIHHLMKYHYSTPYTMHWGDIATGLFFFVSGFGLYSSMSKKQVNTKFLWQNIKKILIPFFVVWILCFVICIIFFRDYFTIGIGGVLRDLFTLTYPQMWPGLWFIKVIVIEYIITILSYIIFKNKWLKLFFPTLFTGIYFITAWKVLQWSPYLFSTTLCFVLGLWIAALNINLNLKVTTKIIGMIVFFVLYLVFRRVNLYLPIPPLTIYAICFSLFSIFAVSVIDIVNPFLLYIGQKSLLFYLIHIPMLLYAMRLIQRDDFNPYFAFGGIFVITYVMSVCYEICETKIIEYNKRN